jgi:hypothetical protein
MEIVQADQLVVQVEHQVEILEMVETVLLMELQETVEQDILGQVMELPTVEVAVEEQDLVVGQIHLQDLVDLAVVAAAKEDLFHVVRLMEKMGVVAVVAVALVMAVAEESEEAE